MKEDDHNLRYQDKTGKVFHVKRKVDGEYSVRDPETNQIEHMTRKVLRGRFKVLRKADQDKVA